MSKDEVAIVNDVIKVLRKNAENRIYKIRCLCEKESLVVVRKQKDMKTIFCPYCGGELKMKEDKEERR